jgi:hypothetical protein
VGYIELRHNTQDIKNILCLVSLRVVYSSQCALHTFSTGPFLRTVTFSVSFIVSTPTVEDRELLLLTHGNGYLQYGWYYIESHSGEGGRQMGCGINKVRFRFSFLIMTRSSLIINICSTL